MSKNFVIKKMLVVILYILLYTKLYKNSQKDCKCLQLQRIVFWEREEKINL